MIAFIDNHRDAHGVESICKHLPIAPSTYHLHAARRADAALLPARTKRDQELTKAIRRVHQASFGLYGVRKVWRRLRRKGMVVARCTVERLMRAIGLAGVVRGKPAKTTVPPTHRGRNAVARNRATFVSLPPPHPLLSETMKLDAGPWMRPGESHLRN